MNPKNERYEIVQVKKGECTQVLAAEADGLESVRPAFMRALALEFKVQEDLRFLTPGRAASLLSKYIVNTCPNETLMLGAALAKNHPIGAVAVGLVGLAMGAKAITSYKDYTTDAEQFPHALYLLLRLDAAQTSALNYTVTGGLVKLLSSSILPTFDTRLGALNQLNDVESADVIQERRGVYSEGLAEGMSLLNALQTHLERLLAEKNKLADEEKQRCREEIERVKLEQSGVETRYQAGLLSLSEYRTESFRLSNKIRSAQYTSVKGSVAKLLKNSELLMLDPSNAEALTAESYCEMFYEGYKDPVINESGGSTFKGLIILVVAVLVFAWLLSLAR